MTQTKTPYNKQNWKPGTLIYPLPAVLVSCGETPEEHNLITVAWTGTICTNPPMCYISVRPSRHSYDIIKRTGEFIINLTTEELARATDWCGVRSGKNYDKFTEMGLTKGEASVVKCPAVAESPISIECKVKEIVPLGSHDMFISEVVNIIADERYLDPETGAFSLKASAPIAYVHGHYFKIGDPIGKFGWSVEKKKKK
ncbi:MAG: flavin reductase family protein [Mangrovibacterium sp.]